VDEYLNLTKPVEITDFFISLCGALSEAVFARYGVDPSGNSYWERLSNFLQSEIQAKEIGVKIPGADLKVELKDNADFKRRIQQNLRDHSAKLVKQAHAFCDEVVGMTRAQEGVADKRVVLILDSVEHIGGI